MHYANHDAAIPASTCKQCGAASERNATHCAYCGAELPRQPAASVRPPEPEVAALPNDVAQLLARANLKPPVASQPLESAGCMFIFAVSWILFSAVFVIFGARYNRLLREGVTTTAVVTRLETRSGEDSDNYYVHYQFSAKVHGDTTRFENRHSVSHAFYRKLAVGQTVEVLYAASAPHTSVIKTEFKRPGPSGWIFSALGGFFVLIGVVLLLNAAKSMRNLQLLRRRGRQAKGIVFARRQEKDSNGDPTYYVAYAFRPAKEAKILTHAEYNKRLYDEYQVGAPVLIRYLPEDPKVCQVWRSL
jgi:hypothetical protein